MRVTLAVLLVIAAAPSLRAQFTCASAPTAQVASQSLADIPATDTSLMAWTGGRFNAKSNMITSIIQTSWNEQKVWFSVDASPGLPVVYYNRRFRATPTSPWYWESGTSRAINWTLPQGSLSMVSVLYDSNYLFWDQATYTSYPYVMYVNFQPHACDGVLAGLLHVAFSADGVCWTTPRQVFRAGGPDGSEFPCLSGLGYLGQLTPIESAGVVADSTKLYFVGLEGNVSLLARTDMMDWTQTYLGSCYHGNPDYITLWSPSPVVSNNAVVSPMVGDWNNRAYLYFLNLQIAYDAQNGDFYISRGYPYPFERNVVGRFPWPFAYGTTLYDPVRSGDAATEGCYGSPATLPNRVQIYKLHIGALSSGIGDITSGLPWTLVKDIGNGVGYGDAATGQPAPLVDNRQLNVGRDPGFASFVRDAFGNIVRNDAGIIDYLAGDTFKSPKSGTATPCRITGLEGMSLQSLP